MSENVGSELARWIEPMPGKIGVLVESKKEYTPSGLYIPVETARTIHEDRATQGTVFALGDDEDLEEPSLPIKVGDIVVFGKYSGTQIKWRPLGPDGQPDRTRPEEKVIIMSTSSVLAVLRNPDIAGEIKVRA